MNQAQGARLRRLSDYLAARGTSRFLFELLVPATEPQLAKFGGDRKRYDLELRPQLMVAAIQALQAQGVEPDLWKVEGLDRREDCENIVAAARADGRDSVACIVLGRGENAQKVREWLRVAATVPGFIGFAVGRTDFWEPLVSWRAGTETRDVAVAEIGRRYRQFAEIFDNARAGTASANE